MDDARRDQALREASVPTLLMCLAQITGDARWLEDPFRPQRDVSIFAEPTGGLSPQAQQVVRESIARVLDELADGRRTLPPLPDEATLHRMMNVCVGERVPSEYSVMAAEEMGFRGRDVAWTAPPAKDRVDAFRVLVIGAGFSGIAAGRQLKAMGLPFDLVEKLPDVGGVWLENDYPEAGVDTPNHFYSFSWAPNLDWTSNYSKRNEVWDYQRRVFDEAGLRPHTEFLTEVVSMAWVEAAHAWDVTTRGPDGATRVRRYRAVITAVGNLNRPKLASIPGLDGFTGTSWHSAQWRHDVPLEDKEVAVIGTGASAMQFLRTVAGRAKKVTIFQRSPQWARPPQDYHGTVSPESRWLLEHVPYYYAWYRFGLMWRFGDGLLPTVKRDPSWPHPERSMNHRNDRQRQQLTDYMLGELEGRPDLVEKCLPSYPPYGKRILIDNGWFQALKRPNVELVTEAVDRIEGDVLVTPSGARHRADVIVLATGFEVGKLLWPMDIRGRSGTPLKAVWGEDDPRAYLGMTVPDYPNLFVMSGPSTGLAHGGSVIFVSECQVRYIASMLREMVEHGIDAVEVERTAHDAYNDRVDTEHADLVWSHPGMNNWYRNKAGRVFIPMPFRLVDYWQMTTAPALSDYRTEPAAG
ncbi:MAG: NAD(P)/FAD-dependent oxidoreductase [Burkholderiales bacterium]